MECVFFERQVALFDTGNGNFVAWRTRHDSNVRPLPSEGNEPAATIACFLYPTTGASSCGFPSSGRGFQSFRRATERRTPPGESDSVVPYN